MKTHTPGPWHTIGNLEDRPLVEAADGGLIADLVEREDDAETRANAILISAAPELFAALRETLEVVEGETCGECGVECETCECDGSAWWRRARAAIARAEGRS
jgi:hypothetical protein